MKNEEIIINVLEVVSALSAIGLRYAKAMEDGQASPDEIEAAYAKLQEGLAVAEQGLSRLDAKAGA